MSSRTARRIPRGSSLLLAAVVIAASAAVAPAAMASSNCPPGTNSGNYCNRIPTKLTATPVLLSGVSATLVRSDTNAPLAGQTLTFTAGGNVLCTAVTDSAREGRLQRPRVGGASAPESRLQGRLRRDGGVRAVERDGVRDRSRIVARGLVSWQPDPRRGPHEGAQGKAPRDRRPAPAERVAGASSPGGEASPQARRGAPLTRSSGARAGQPPL